MINRTIISTERRKEIAIAHICSNCGFPVVTIVNIISQVSEECDTSHAKTEQSVMHNADSAITGEIHRIERCYHTKRPLYNREMGTISKPGYYRHSSISGFDSKCPYCGNIEPWQSSSHTSSYSIDELEKNSFPLVFSETNPAFEWSNQYIDDLVKEIEQKRTDPTIVEESTKKVNTFQKRIHQWERQLQSIPEIKIKNGILDKLNELNKKKSELTRLDLRGNLSLNKEIKSLQSELSELNETIEYKEQPIKEKIEAIQSQLFYERALAFGCTSETEQIKYLNSYTILYVPKVDIDSSKLISNNQESSSITEVVNSHNSNSKDTNTIAFCRHCGFKLLPNSVYCSKCGCEVS